MIHINAHVVDVSIGLQHRNMIFKLSNEKIEALVGFYKDVYLVDYEANISSQSKKEAGLNELHENFVWAVNNFVFYTSTIALEKLDEIGTGMLSSDESETI